MKVGSKFEGRCDSRYTLDNDDGLLDGPLKAVRIRAGAYAVRCWTEFDLESFVLRHLRPQLLKAFRLLVFLNWVCCCFDQRDY